MWGGFFYDWSRRFYGVVGGYAKFHELDWLCDDFGFSSFVFGGVVFGVRG